jgi:hypothetical protein
VKLGTENRKQLIAAGILGVVLIAILVYEFMPSSSTIASTAPATAPQGWESKLAEPPAAHSVPRHGASTAAVKKTPPAQNLDPTLHLAQLAADEQIKYEGSGRNVFVAQADVPIPTPLAPGQTDVATANKIYTPPPVSAPPPIPLKFFGFASKPGEPKKIFLSKGDDVFIAGEGEVIDRRYKVVRILPNAVEIQDVVGSGPPQSIPLTLG